MELSGARVFNSQYPNCLKIYTCLIFRKRIASVNLPKYPVRHTLGGYFEESFLNQIGLQSWKLRLLYCQL